MEELSPGETSCAGTLTSGLRGGQGIDLGRLRLRVPAVQVANAGDREDRDARDDRPDSRSVEHVGGAELVCERSDEDESERVKSTEPAQPHELTRDSACCGTCCCIAVNQIVPAKFIPPEATSVNAEIAQLAPEHSRLERT